MQQLILTLVAESTAVTDRCVRDNLAAIESTARILSDCFATGHKVLLFGNGGSAADAQHIAAEFVNRFLIERPPLAAIALTTDSSILTSVANDDRYESIFAKQVRALGRRNDVAWGLSTSGNSPNVLAGIQAAREAGMVTIGMSGRRGRLTGAVDQALTVYSDVTARVQEAHIVMAHILCELVERTLFPDQFPSEALPSRG